MDMWIIVQGHRARDLEGLGALLALISLAVASARLHSIRQSLHVTVKSPLSSTAVSPIMNPSRVLSPSAEVSLAPAGVDALIGASCCYQLDKYQVTMLKLACQLNLAC
jgi:hypothetical protein